MCIDTANLIALINSTPVFLLSIFQLSIDRLHPVHLFFQFIFSVQKFLFCTCEPFSFYRNSQIMLFLPAPVFQFFLEAADLIFIFLFFFPNLQKKLFFSVDLFTSLIQLDKALTAKFKFLNPFCQFLACSFLLFYPVPLSEHPSIFRLQ